MLKSIEKLSVEWKPGVRFFNSFALCRFIEGGSFNRNTTYDNNLRRSQMTPAGSTPCLLRVTPWFFFTAERAEFLRREPQSLIMRIRRGGERETGRLSD